MTSVHTGPNPTASSDRHAEDLTAFRLFAAEHIAPFADEWDQAGALPAGFVARLGAAGYLGALVPVEYGGSGADLVTFGLRHQAIGAACSSVRSVLTVHSMVVRAITRWGDRRQRERWLPSLATGASVGAFALTEAEAGSDTSRLCATVRADGDGHLLDGTKQWITYGQAADVFLVFATGPDGPVALLVERDNPGLTVEPTPDVLGTRASMLATLTFRSCRVSANALVGRPGFGLAAVATDALNIGRYSVACGCVGISQACLDLSLRHAARRQQFGAPIIEHQLVARMITDMATGLAAGRQLCLRAGAALGSGDQNAVLAVWTAKYFAATAAANAAADAVQIHGAAGCGQGHPAQRMFRDAKVMEIIEGSTQIQQVTIARLLAQRGSDSW
jgi:glutaryl-CoA dehydrogenase (non-decarboxylating)